MNTIESRLLKHLKSNLGAAHTSLIRFPFETARSNTWVELDSAERNTAKEPRNKGARHYVHIHFIAQLKVRNHYMTHTDGICILCVRV